MASWLTCTLLLGGVTSRAETAVEQADRTRQEMLDLLATQPKQGDNSAVARENSDEVRGMRNVLRAIDEARRELGFGEESSALFSLIQAGEVAKLPPAIRSSVDALIAKLQAEKSDREKVFLAQVEATCRQTGEVALQAKEAKELDGLLQKLTILSKDKLAIGPGSSSVQGRLRAATMFVSRWQEYLLENQSGGFNISVPTTLRNLASDTDMTVFVPRSEILARLAAYERRDPNNRPQISAQQTDANVRAILQKTKSLEDLSGSVNQLIALEQSITSSSSYSISNASLLRTALPVLDELHSRYLEFCNGLEVHLGLRDNFTGLVKIPELEATLLPLRMQLLKLAVPRLLQAGKVDKPSADETAEDFLNRFIQEAKQRRDWAAAMRGLEVRHALNPVRASPMFAAQEQAVSSYRDFLAAVYLEEAKCYEQATTLYFEVLRSGQEDLPAAFIGERLAAIRKEHPTEYQNGVKRVFPPPTATAATPTQPGGTKSAETPAVPQKSPYEPPEILDDSQKLIIPAITPAPGATPGATTVSGSLADPRRG